MLLFVRVRVGDLWSPTSCAEVAVLLGLRCVFGCWRRCVSFGVSGCFRVSVVCVCVCVCVEVGVFVCRWAGGVWAVICRAICRAACAVEFASEVAFW